MNENQEKIAKAAAKRKAEMSKVKASSSSKGWVSEASKKKKGHPLISEIQDYFVAATAERGKDRDTAHIHPSEMAKTDWCPKNTLYRVTGTDPDDGWEPEKIYWRLASIFEEGHGIHTKHQDALWEMGVLYGVWKCLHCEHQWWALSPAVCESCTSVHVEYREVPLDAPSLHLIGHTDGIHLDDDGVHRNLEMKSVGVRTIEIEIPGVYARWKESAADLNALWSAIKIPFPSHQRQVQIYMAVLRIMGYDVNETLFIYEFKATQDLKGFTVKYNEKAANKILDVAVGVVRAREDGTDVDRPDWADPKAKGCRECAYKARCWA